MNGGNGELAQNVSGKPPWWATAPIWLAAGIVGVPSLIAIGAGYFIASTVTKHLSDLTLADQAEIVQLNRIESNQLKYWEMVRRTIAATFEVQARQCINAATDAQQRDNCLKGIAQAGVEK